MRNILLSAALGGAALAVPALSQTSVEIHTGANGQLTGSSTAGSISSGVTAGPAGTDAGTRNWDERAARGGCGDGNRTRSMRVVSPDGSSSSSVSVSGGTVAVGGSGSPGSRISEGGCADTATNDTDRSTSRPPVRHRTAAHTTRHRTTPRR